MMELLHHVLKGDLVEGSKNTERPHQNGRNAKSIVQICERCASSKLIQEEGKQDLRSVMEVQRSPRHTNTQTSLKSTIPVVDSPVTCPKHGVLEEVAAKSPAPPRESKASSDSSTEDFRGVKRKSSSVHKETVQAIENASHTIAESIDDRMHTAISQVAADAVKEHDVFFHTELKYLKKRDQHLFRNQQNLISAINALTEIITTGIKKPHSRRTGRSKETVDGADAG